MMASSTGEATVTLVELGAMLGAHPDLARNLAGDLAAPDWAGRPSVSREVAERLVRERREYVAAHRADVEAHGDYLRRRAARREEACFAAYRAAAAKARRQGGIRSMLTPGGLLGPILAGGANIGREEGREAYQEAGEAFDRKSPALTFEEWMRKGRPS